MTCPDVLDEVTLRVAGEGAEAAVVRLLPSVDALVARHVVDGGKRLKRDTWWTVGNACNKTLYQVWETPVTRRGGPWEMPQTRHVVDCGKRL